MLDSLEKKRDPEYQSKLEKKLKEKKNGRVSNSTFNVSKSGINNDFNAFYKEKKTVLSKQLLMKIKDFFGKQN